MNKILFYTDPDKKNVYEMINEQLKVKNRLIQVIQENTDDKLTDKDL